MNKAQLSFTFAGLLFGFLIGFVVAHEIWAGRGASFAHPPIPPGMEGAVAGAPPDRPTGGTAQGASAGAGGTGAPDMAMMEQVQKEITGLKAALEKDPTNVAALTRLGDMNFDAGKFDAAADFYAKALAAKPDDVNIETDLGTCLRNLGRATEALRHFESAVGKDPNHWKGWFNVGIVAMYDLGDFDRAQRAFEKVAQLNPGAINMDALREEMAKERAKKAQGDGPS
jgi:hypothetical protein